MSFGVDLSDIEFFLAGDLNDYLECTRCSELVDNIIKSLPQCSSPMSAIFLADNFIYYKGLTFKM